MPIDVNQSLGISSRSLFSPQFSSFIYQKLAIRPKKKLSDSFWTDACQNIQHFFHHIFFIFNVVLLGADYKKWPSLTTRVFSSSIFISVFPIKQFISGGMLLRFCPYNLTTMPHVKTGSRLVSCYVV